MATTLDTAKLDELIAKSPEKVDAAVRATAFFVQAIAQADCPVDTGATRNSGFTKTSKDNGFAEAESRASSLRPDAEMVDGTPGDPGPMTAYVSFATNYAIWLELGTSRMGARPFLGPAVEGADGIFAEQIAKVMNE